MTGARRFKIGKLVRDKFPDIIESKGGYTFSRCLAPQDLVYHLKLKLKEEVEELLSAQTLEDFKEELGDILEVLDALAKNKGFEMSEIERLRLHKKEQRGGFIKGLFTEWVEIKPSELSHSALQYYLTHPEKYPEILSTAVDESYR